MTKKNRFLETIALTGNVSTSRQMTTDVCHSEKPKNVLKNSGSPLTINIIKVYVTWSNNSEKKKLQEYWNYLVIVVSLISVFNLTHLKSKQIDHFLSFKVINGKRTCAHTLNTVPRDFWPKPFRFVLENKDSWSIRKTLIFLTF